MINLEQKYTVYEAVVDDYTYKLTVDNRGVIVHFVKTGNFHSARSIGVLHPDGSCTPLLNTTTEDYFCTLSEAVAAIEKFEALW